MHRSHDRVRGREGDREWSSRGRPGAKRHGVETGAGAERAKTTDTPAGTSIMSNRMTYRGRSALITGASSGVGEEFARGLARRGMAVLLTALPSEFGQLQALAAEVAERYDVRAETVALDL